MVWRSMNLARGHAEGGLVDAEAADGRHVAVAVHPDDVRPQPADRRSHVLRDRPATFSVTAAATSSAPAGFSWNGVSSAHEACASSGVMAGSMARSRAITSCGSRATMIPALNPRS